MSFGNNYRNSDIGLTNLQKASEATDAVDVLLVTTPGFPRAREWIVCKLRDQGLPIGNVNIYAYEAWSSFHEDFTWDTLLDHGNFLVRLLETRYNSGVENSSPRPVVLMAHSLAAFIVKKSLVLIHTQKARYRLLRDVIKGVVFMGCPHTSSPGTRSNFMKKCLKILEIAMERRGQRVKNLTRLEHGQDLVDVCTQFDAMGGNVSILTLHESMNTKVARGFRPASTMKLVDAGLARVDFNKFETLVEIPSDHRNLPCLGDGTLPDIWSHPAIGHIRGLIERAQEAGRQISSLVADAPTESTGLEPLMRDLAPRRPYPDVPAFLVDMSIPRQRNRDFQGRGSILSKLRQHLLDGPQLILLHGQGGFGKSETAIEVAHRHEKDFDVILWVQADDLSKLRQDFGSFAARLGLELGDTATDPFTSRELVKDWLIDPVKRNCSGQGELPAKWLVIFDGVDSMETLTEFTSIYGKGSVLVTSRHHDLFDAFERAQLTLPKDDRVKVNAMNLDLFSESEGAAVLKKLADLETTEDADDQAARDIVGLLKGWPLAIRQMAGIIRNNDLTLTELYERFKDEQSHGLSDPGSGRDTMISSIRMAKLSPNAMALLRVCAMLDPDCIQESLFAMESMVETVLEDFPLTVRRFEDARDEILSSSLVQRNETRQELWMHREVQDAVRELCTPSIFDLAFRTAAALVREAWHPVPERVRDKLKLWEPCAAFLRHVLNLQQVYTRNTATRGECGFRTKIRPCFSFAWLLHEVGCFQRGLGDTSGIESTLVLALTICEQLPRAKAFSLLCEIYHGLGAWANETNRAQECLRYNTLYVQLWEQALKDGEVSNERTAAAWNQYGTGLTMVRRYREAMDAYKTSIRLYAELALDTPCPDSLPVVNLGLVEWQIGSYESAWARLSAGQKAREDAFGFMDTESFRSGRFFHALGNVCYDQGNMSKSEFWHTQALDQYIQSLGPRHHRTADVCHRVADHCLKKGDLEKAGSLIDQALGSWRMDTASFKPEIARTTWLKAQHQELSGDLGAAADLREEAARLRGELVPGDKRPPKHLTDEDFNDLVAFWSR